MTPQGKAALVRSVYETGMSAGEIARKLGRAASRNAVIGVYMRNKDLARECPLGGGNTFRKSPLKTLGIRREIFSAPRETLPLPEPVMIAAPSLKLTLDQLTDRVCKWPTHGPDEIGMTYFCGHPRERGSYCAAHHKLSVGRGTDEERAALRGIKG